MRPVLSWWPEVLSLPLLLLAGCATPPPSQVERLPVSYPQTWSALETEPHADLSVTGGWLDDFQNPELEALVFRALEENLNLQATAARLGVAEAGATIAGADLFPQVSAGLGASRRKINFAAQGLGNIPGLSSTRITNYDLSAALTWEIDVWGRIRNRQSAALADVQAAEADLRGATLSLAARTAAAWFDAIEAELQAELAESTYHSFKKTTDTIQRRFENGVGPALDLRLSRAQTAAAEAEWHLRSQQVDANKRALMVLLGEYPSADIRLPRELPALPPAVPAGLPAELLTRRPDLIRAERELAAADQRLLEAKKAFLPAISLTGSYGTVSNDLEDLLNRNFSVWSLAGNLVQPLFLGGRLTAAKEQARYVVQEKVARYGQIALEAFREVEVALATETYLRQVESALKIAADESISAEKTAWDRYQRGLTDIITVLEGQRRAFEARSALLAVRNDLLRNRLNLYLALGGNFAPTAHDDLPPQENPLAQN